MISVKQGDSLWIDVQVPLYANIDDTWSNWSGTFEIASTITGTPAVTGNLTRSSTMPGVFYLRLNSDNATWIAVTPAKYRLMVEITNSSVKYKEERHDTIIIKAQGI